MPALLDKLTIIVPVYNDVRYIAETVESCALQGALTLIYDNASTDGTSEICANLEKKYPNVRHIRHPENLGAFENFRRSLMDCATEYFCWVGSHDLLGRDYAAPLVAALEKDKDAIVACGTVQYIDEEGAEMKKTVRACWASRSKNAAPLRRVAALVSGMRDCTIFYAVFRTEMMRGIWQEKPFLGFDRALLTKAAAAGKILYEPGPVFYFRDFSATRDGKKDQDRRTREIVHEKEKPLPRDLLQRNMSMVQTALGLVKTPEDLSLALRIVDKINRRYQSRRYYQRLRLLKIAGVVAIMAIFAALHFL